LRASNWRFVAGNKTIQSTCALIFDQNSATPHGAANEGRMAKLTNQQKSAINSIWVGAAMAAKYKERADVLSDRADSGEHCAHAAAFAWDRWLSWSQSASEAELSIGIDVLAHR
jgi:hypothetical protein